MIVSEVVFLTTTFVVLYVILGYPLLLRLMVSSHTQPILRSADTRKVSLILPVRNGEEWIREKLGSILALDYPPDSVEILIVSDGSTDQTESIVGEFSDPRIQFLRLAPAGKAAALNEAISKASGEILFFTDVRQPLGADSLRNLVSCFADSRVGVVSGELVMLPAMNQSESSSGLYWRYEKWIRKQLSQIDSVPGATGCIYAMRRELAVRMPVGTLADDMYLPIAAFLMGFRIIFDETARAFDRPVAVGAEFRRKVRTLAGVYQVIAAFPVLLTPRNRMWFHFLSHKAARLLLPWALLVNFVACVFLPAPWSFFGVFTHAIVWALATLDYVAPERSFLKKLTSPARTFLALMIAAACAASVFFLPSQIFWTSRPPSLEMADSGSRSSQDS